MASQKFDYSVEKFGITQFDGKNFDHWKFRVETVLDHYGVKKCITEQITSPTEEQIKLDKKCKSVIVQCVANSHLEYIKDKNTSYDMWKALEKVFQRKGVASQLYLRRKLLTMKFNANEMLETHFTKFEETIRELKSVGATLEEVDIVCHLLLTLPKSYDTIVTALETLETNKLTLEFVKGKLLDHEVKRKNFEERNDSDLAAFSGYQRNMNTRNAGTSNKHYQKENKSDTNYTRQKDSKGIKCHNCGKVGHFRKQCWFISKRQANQVESKEEKQENISFTAAAMNTEAATVECGEDFVNFVVDSGATDHMINSDKYFTNSKNLQGELKIAVAKEEESLSCSKVGNVYVKLSNCIAEIKDIFYVKNLRQNLLSVQKLESAGLEVIFKENSVFINKNSKLLAKGSKINNLYVIKFKLEPYKNYANFCEQNSNIKLWHSRLGHLSCQNVLKLAKNNMVEGVNISMNNLKGYNSEICSICAQTKITRLPFTKVSGKVTKRPLEVVHSDICGPISPTTYDNKRYFLTFLDDYTHFSMVYLLESKNEVFKCFTEFEARVTNLTGYRIGSLYCDNGSEYCSHNFKAFCRTKGIHIRYNVPYNPETNGAAERLNRTLLEKGRAMLLQSQLPKTMWGESILCATYILNRSPTVCLKDVTPAEMFYKKKPNLKNIKVFGSLVYDHIPKEKQNSKFDTKANIRIMIGYQTNGYRLWDPIKKKAFSGRNVIFDEAKNINDMQMIDTYLDLNDTENVKILIKEKTDEESLTEEMENETDNEVSEEKVENEGNRKSHRVRKTPSYFNDYITENEIEHMALNASAFVENVPESLEKAKSMPDYKNWKNAVKEEINALNLNKTWTLVEKPKDARVIDCKWVFRTKRNDLGEIVKYKARLVAKGFMQREGFDFEETYAPVARLVTVRTLLAVANFKNLEIQQMDVKSAFLHGKINEDIYMNIPEGFVNDGRVCKLNKALYGLKQAPYCWNKRFDEFVRSERFTKSNNDPCLYIRINENITTYLLLYVDDILIVSSNMQEIEKIKSILNKEFHMQDIGDLKAFLGINVRRTKDGIYLSQRDYIINLLNRFNMTECKSIKTPMESRKFNINGTNEHNDKRPIRELIGCLMYLMLATRPDLSMSINLCSRYQGNPTEELWKSLKRILRYLQGTMNLELFYPKNSEKLIGFVDADWAGDEEDRKSTTGYLFKVFGCTVTWSTKKQSTVATSSTEAEYVALAESVKEGIWLSKLLNDLGFTQSQFVMFEDNQSCIKLTKRWDHKRLKHIDVKYNFIKDLVIEKMVLVEYVRSNEQIADILTKNLPGDLFIKHRFNLGLLLC